MWALSRARKVYNIFTKVGRGPWLKRKLYLGPTGVINCRVSWFPGAFSYNTHRILLIGINQSGQCVCFGGLILGMYEGDAF